MILYLRVSDLTADAIMELFGISADVLPMRSLLFTD